MPGPQIKLPGGHTLLFDQVDTELVMGRLWRALKPTRSRTYYAASGGNNDLLHRLIMAAPPGLDVDHRNGNGLDDRRSNLRLATRSQNLANQAIGAANKSGYKGVYRRWDDQKWAAQVKIAGKAHYLGSFEDPWDAAQAYNQKAFELFGEFARLNNKID